MSNNQKQALLEEMLQQYNDRENDFPVVDDLSKIEEGYKGYVLNINDHGNATIWKCFKNGNLREIASIV